MMPDEEMFDLISMERAIKIKEIVKSERNKIMGMHRKDLEKMSDKELDRLHRLFTKSSKILPREPAQDTLPEEPVITNNTTETPEQIKKNTLIAAGVGTPITAAGVGYKYSKLPQEPDVEMQEIRPYTDEVPTEQLIDHPMEQSLTEAQETNIDIPEQVIRQRSRATLNPNIMEPMEIEEATDLAAGGTAAATLTTAGSGPAVGVTTLGVLGVGGLGVGIAGTKKIQQRMKEKGAVLPGSDYIGPGNPIHIAPARSEADQIAKEHDIAYEKLIQDAKNGILTEEEFKQKLYAIDDEAITKFGNDDSWHALIGRYGLKFKTTLEKTINKPLYPQCE